MVKGYLVEIIEKIDEETYKGKDVASGLIITFSSRDEIEVGRIDVIVPLNTVIDIEPLEYKIKEFEQID